VHPFRHFMTVTRHRHAVFRHCCKAGIPWQGMRHDLSKYAPTEFWPGARYYLGTRSPNEGERRAVGYSVAWMHHKGRNRHHFEYWTDYNLETRRVEPVEMPVRFVAEMFCDRIAAGEIYNGAAYKHTDPLAYYERARDRRVIHPATDRLIYGWLTVLAEQGEDAAYATVREAVKADRRDRRAKRSAR